MDVTEMEHLNIAIQIEFENGKRDGGEDWYCRSDSVHFCHRISTVNI